MGNKLYFTETFRGGSISFKLDEVLYAKKSKYQDILIGKSQAIGSFLALDGKINSSEKDYFIYHEAIVHPCMMSLDAPKRVLDIGSGEGTTINELLKYDGITVDWVDIDKDVVEASKRHLPYAWKGSSNRVKPHISDGIKFLEKSEDKYDLIMADLTEPSRANPLSNKLYSEDFANMIDEKLTDQGMYITLCWEKINSAWKYKLRPEYLAKVFKFVTPIHFFMPSFASDFGLVIASKKRDPSKMTAEKIKRKIARFRDGLFFYDEDTHNQLFHFNRYQKNFL